MATIRFNPRLDDPRKALTTGERALLRIVDTYVARKVPNGWRCGGTFYRDATLRRLVQLGLAEEIFRDGRHCLEPNVTGRTVLAILDARPAAPDDLFASARR